MMDQARNTNHLNINTSLYGLNAKQIRDYQIFRFCLPVPFTAILLLMNVLFQEIAGRNDIMKFCLFVLLFAAGYWPFSVLCVRCSEFILDHQDPKFTWRTLNGFLKNRENFRESRTKEEYQWILFFFLGALGIVLLAFLIGRNIVLMMVVQKSGWETFTIGINAILMGSLYGMLILSILLPFYMIPFMKRLFWGMVNLSVNPEAHCTSVFYPQFDLISFSVGAFTSLMLWTAGWIDSSTFDCPKICAELMHGLPWAAALYVNLLWCETFVFQGIHSLRKKEKEKETEAAKNPWLRHDSRYENRRLNQNC